MPSATLHRDLTVALIGNPNTGKSTLFSALAGVRQRVGNYPGVTVEKKIGRVSWSGQWYALVDLPGSYSLAPRSPDEMVAVDVLLGRLADSKPPDAVLCIVDASNLERNLYLVSQVLELGLPTVIALNMIDVATQRGVRIDVPALSQRLGAPVVAIEAHRRRGLDALKEALARSVESPVKAPASPFPDAFQAEVAHLESVLARSVSPGGAAPLPRYLVERLLLDTAGYLQDTLLAHEHASLADEVRQSRSRLAAAGAPVPAVEAVARYGWVAKILAGVIERPASRPVTASDRLDRLLTHRLAGTLIFLAMMVIVFQAVFRWATPLMDLISAATDQAGDTLGSMLPEGALQSLVVDGLVAGVGGVLIFLPQIVILFFFIAVLEDCGYMARAAYLMDKLMVRVGLSGKSFIPLLSSFACAIPGVMAARVIENRRDRLTTILVAPLMSCSARVPVYVLLAAAFIPDRSYLGGLVTLPVLTMTAMYLLGILVAAAAALILKRTLLRGPTPAFVMELPSYKWPSPRNVIGRMVERGWSFVRRAGTLVVVVSVLVWAALYYPHDSAQVEAPFQAEADRLEQAIAATPPESPRLAALEAERNDLERRIAGAYNRQSILGRLGHWIEPAVRPLGWDWRIGCAVIASFPAREVVVATLGIIYNQGADVDVENPEDASRLHGALRSATWDGSSRKVFNVPVALSLMVFFSLCAQCASTLVTIWRETNSWFWPSFTFVYMTSLAYLGALVTYQVGMWLSA